MRSALASIALFAAACSAPLPPSPPPHPSPIPVGVPASPVLAAPSPPHAPAPSRADASGAVRAVFHFSDPARPANLRGLENARRALAALGSTPAHLVLVVHGQALGWFRKAEKDNLAEPLAALLATGKVELRVCARTLEENHWQLSDILKGAASVPSGSAEVLKLERDGYAYFKP
ncbi:MAG: DsrE family protein [Minicystis sp.]